MNNSNALSNVVQCLIGQRYKFATLYPAKFNQKLNAIIICHFSLAGKWFYEAGDKKARKITQHAKS